ncbi:MAG: PEP-CTERM sorting domain-containing protein [Edaphobacter sp.]
MKYCLRAFSLVFCIALLLATSVTPRAAHASNMGGAVPCDAVGGSGELCDPPPPALIDFNTSDGDIGLNHSFRLTGEAANNGVNSVPLSNVDYEIPSRQNSDNPTEGTPEPSTFLLLGTGLFLAAGLVRHRMRPEPLPQRLDRVSVSEAKVVEIRQRAA